MESNAQATGGPLLGAAEPWYVRWRGVIATALLIALLEFITGTLQVTIGNKHAFVALGVVYSAFVGGVWPGLVSAAVAVVYSCTLLSDGGSFFTFSSGGRQRLLTFIFVVPTAGLMIGVL